MLFINLKTSASYLSSPFFTCASLQSTIIHPPLSPPADYLGPRVGSLSLGPEAVTGDTACLTIPLVNDSIPESPETLTLSIRPSSAFVVIGANSSATITIIDDDGRCLSLYSHTHSLIVPVKSEIYKLAMGYLHLLCKQYSL